ncbi:MAG: hypothetical protein GX684_02665 [Ruminococcaceae bacterium]|nr:hypothetical protein [Oscillospiraceae bacterium]
MKLFSKKRINETYSEEYYEEDIQEDSFNELALSGGNDFDVFASADDEFLVEEDYEPEQKLSVFSVLGFILTFILIVYSLTARAQLIAVKDDCSKLEGSIKQVSSEISALNLIAEKNFNEFRLKDEAEKRFNMIKPNESQKVLLSYPDSDICIIQRTSDLNHEDGILRLISKIIDPIIKLFT